MTVYETITKSILVKEKGSPMYDLTVTEIGVETDVDGVYVYVRHDPDVGSEQVIRIDQAEWPHIQSAIAVMMSVCREQNKDGK